MSNFINVIRTSMASEVFWMIIGIVVGKVFEILFSLSKEKIRKYRLKRDLAKNDSFLVETVDILSLDHADPAYELHDIIVNLTDKKLFIDCPDDYKGIIQGLDSSFAFSNNHSFNRTSTFADLAAITNIENLPELISNHSKLVAQFIIAKIENRNTIFNGKKYGVYQIQRKRIADQDENASIRLDLFETDYFTHLVFRSIYKELKAEGHPISKIKKMEELHCYTPFLTSFGVNAFIVNDTPSGDEIVFAKRSKFLSTGTSQSQWHVTMNEGLTYTDKEGGDISLIKCLHRGLREELGIKEEHHKYISDERFMDLFLEMSKFEIGLSSFIRMESSMTQLNELYSIAKDGELETDGLVAVPLKKNDLKQFIESETLTSASSYVLKMLIARRKYLS